MVPFPILGVIIHCPASMLVHVVLIVGTCLIGVESLVYISPVCTSVERGSCLEATLASGLLQVIMCVLEKSMCLLSAICCQPVIFTHVKVVYHLYVLVLAPQVPLCVVHHLYVLILAPRVTLSSYARRLIIFIVVHGLSCSVFAMSQPVLNVLSVFAMSQPVLSVFQLSMFWPVHVMVHAISVMQYLSCPHNL